VKASIVRATVFSARRHRLTSIDPFDLPSMIDIWRHSGSSGSDAALPLTDPSIRRIHKNRLASLLALIGLWTSAGLSQDALPPASAAAPQPMAAATVKVVLRTALGDIVLALEKERAPVTVNNFLRYVDQKRLDGTEFYRALILDEQGQYGLIQGGLRNNPKRVFKPIAHEPTTATGLSHVSGAISMARAEPGTASGDFFIVIGDNISYDAQPDGGDPGYAVFGRVSEGMDVVRAILQRPRSGGTGEGVMSGQMIANPVKILTARRAD
jgi:peptidyl-prolyl cis-trans isomerase A (cyclophilin A)